MIVFLNVPGLTVSFKLCPSCWCLFAGSSEGHLTSFQVWGLVVELEH